MRIHTQAISLNAIKDSPLRARFSPREALSRIFAALLVAAAATAAVAADTGGTTVVPALQAGATAEERAKFLEECARIAKEPSQPGPLVGDPVRGALLPRGCFSCHGLERYTAPVTHATASFLDAVLRASGLSDIPPAKPTRFRGKITSLAGLREAVASRNEFISPKLTPQQIEDIVAYLNVTYYKFPQ